MIPARNRRAKFIATLIYADEPQLIYLKDRDVPVVALAVPDEDVSRSMFVATTASKKDWQSYLDGNCDLRYLFTYPKARLIYTFDLNDLKDGYVKLEPFKNQIPEAFLPAPRMFSVFHTEEFEVEPTAADDEVLIVDGEWDMPEFGNFYQRYSDVYAFIAAIRNWKSAGILAEVKQNIQHVFHSKPFQGGFSYVHFFNDLAEQLLRSQRLGLEKISYASPGTVEIRGESAIFDELESLIPHFMDDRLNIYRQYLKLYKYLSENKYLQMPGDHYVHVDAVTAYIIDEARALSEMMTEPDFETVHALARQNPLVTAKIILSFYRRLDEAAAYFAQGRVSFK